MKKPDLLYKYRIWDERNTQDSYQNRLLINNEIYLSSANQFNDPFDSSTPFQYQKKDLKKRKIYKKLCWMLKLQNPTLSNFEIHQICKKRLYSGFYKDENYIKEYYENYIKSINEEFGIFSLSKSKSNLLMWSHYSDSHKGYCIGFDHKMLLSISGSLGSVIYSNSFPKLSLFPKSEALDFLKLLRTKSKEWEYEEEYRIVLRGKSRKTIHFTDECIREVILGCNMSEINKNDIIKIVQKKNSSIRIFETKISLKKYELEITEINTPSLVGI